MSVIINKDLTRIVGTERISYFCKNGILYKVSYYYFWGEPSLYIWNIYSSPQGTIKSCEECKARFLCNKDFTFEGQEV